MRWLWIDVLQLMPKVYAFIRFISFITFAKSPLAPALYALERLGASPLSSLWRPGGVTAPAEPPLLSQAKGAGRAGKASTFHESTNHPYDRLPQGLPPLRTPGCCYA